MEEGGMKRAMGWRRKAVTNYCRLRGEKGIGRWWEDKIGRVDDAECPKCGKEEQTPDHIVFRCGKVGGIAGMRWHWVRMEESGRVDDEGRPIVEKVDLMEAFFAGVHRQM